MRVCEDILRFVVNERNLTLSFKRLRHQIDTILEKYPFFSKETLLKYRDAKQDVGKNLTVGIIKKDINDLFFANIQRVKEALRVLEEISKIFAQKAEENFRKLRFHTYYLEKKASKVILKYGKKRFI